MYKRFFIVLDKKLAADTVEQIRKRFGIAFVEEPKMRKLAKVPSDIGTKRSKEICLQEVVTCMLDCNGAGDFYFVLPEGKPFYIGKAAVCCLDDNKTSFATVAELDWEKVFSLIIQYD